MVTFGLLGALEAKYCEIRTYDESGLAWEAREVYSWIGGRVEEALAHGTIVSFLYPRSRLFVTGMNSSDCGNLWIVVRASIFFAMAAPQNSVCIGTQVTS